MSRRRPPRSSGGLPKHQLDVYCTRGGSHGEDRIAKVIVTIYEDAEMPHHVRVEYIGKHDRDDERRDSWESRGEGTQLWRVHSFPCHVCGWDAPVRDDRLALLVIGYSEMGKRRVELTTLRDALR